MTVLTRDFVDYRVVAKKYGRYVEQCTIIKGDYRTSLGTAHITGKVYSQHWSEDAPHPVYIHVPQSIIQAIQYWIDNGCDTV